MPALKSNSTASVLMVKMGGNLRRISASVVVSWSPPAPGMEHQHKQRTYAGTTRHATGHDVDVRGYMPGEKDTLEP